MNLNEENSISEYFIKGVYFFFFISILILVLKYFFTEVNDNINYIFGTLYFLVLLIIFNNMAAEMDDKKSLLFWVLQNFLYLIFLLLEYHHVVKFFILYQVLVGAIYSNKQLKIFKKQNEKIKYLSFHDEMTGLYNRRYFENKLEELKNPADSNISVIIADINNLKVINDNHGHKKGDEYIKSAANLLKSELREKDFISRIGGDEFAIILPDTNKAECKKIVKRFKEKIKRHPEKHFSIAFGYIYKSHEYDSLEEMVNSADKKMYHDKSKFKSRSNKRINYGYNIIDQENH